MATSTVGYLDPPSTRYALAVSDALRGTLDGQLVGVYLYGSGTVGDFTPGSSDVDLVAVVRDPLGPERSEATGSVIREVPRPPPTPGLDLHLVSLASAAVADPLPSFELQMLTFIDWQLISSPEKPAEPRLNMHYVCCRRHGLALIGPPARKLFTPRARGWYVAQLLEELYRSLSRVPHYRVLNACRDWRYLEENVICSKRLGGEWALERVADRALVEGALEWQARGSGPLLDAVRVEEFVGEIAEKLRAVL